MNQILHDTRQRLATAASVVVIAMMTAPAAHASGSSMPWEAPLQSILESIEGPVAKIIAVIIIIILEQINNQITSLQNEAQMLINQARNLTSLPYSSLQQLQQAVGRTQSLLQQAQNIAFDVQQIDQAFQQKYANIDMSASEQQLVADARSRWENTVGGLQDAMRVQAGVVGNIETNRAQMEALVDRSQGATGALQATQAGNQLLALQAQRRPKKAESRGDVPSIGASAASLYFVRVEPAACDVVRSQPGDACRRGGGA